VKMADLKFTPTARLRLQSSPRPTIILEPFLRYQNFVAIDIRPDKACWQESPIWRTMRVRRMWMHGARAARSYSA
jgi:hypothetical protein